MHNTKNTNLTRFICSILVCLIVVLFVGITWYPISDALASGVQFPAYGTIQNSAVSVVQRNIINFIFSSGAGSCVDNSGTKATDCTITGATTGSVTTGVTLTSGLPVIGAGASAVAVGTRTGNTTLFLSGTGSYTNGNATKIDASGNVIDSGFASQAPLHSIGFTLDGGGSVISTGDTKLYPTADAAGAINRIDISADQSCSITVDVWKKAAAIPTSADKISASAPLTLSSAQLAQNGSRTGWTTSVSVGDVFGFSVATIATCTRVVGQIWYQ